MPTLLAIETSSEIASAALLHEGQCHHLSASGVQNHSQHILPMVQELLRNANLRIEQCDAIVFGAGPGSFTGVRTACGIAQGLGFAAKRPLLPVITLAAMAQACLVQRATAATFDVLAVLDARMNQVYWAQYRWQDGAWQTLQAPTLSNPADVVAEGQPYLCGNGLDGYALPQLAALLAQAGQRIVEVQVPMADAMAQLALTAFQQGQAIAAEHAQPLYLRNKIAYTSAERAAGMQPKAGT
ncbi:MAG: tRNA (adenosine(37)-N6)-threonylcarbamoyltransferase complex dimerization subunit type 1 TsaB [Burkholderiales bacterium]|nr:tRNA (adenosine(37)-N6)-threonylcarbamoyltransferase complex dimerization subunit type 1 TsaB [Burkholderiales bacterium]